MSSRDPLRHLLAGEWKRTAVIALLIAVVAGIRAQASTPSWDTGDLLVGLYFATLSLVFWLGAIWVRQGPAGAFRRLRLAGLVVGVGLGGVLALLDVVTNGVL